jgi:general secretion pathway protein C
VVDPMSGIASMRFRGLKARWLALSIGAAVAASVSFWGAKFLVLVARAPTEAGVTTPIVALPGDLTAARGDDSLAKPVPAVVPAAASPRFQLFGVIALHDPNSSSQGVALLAVDGRPSRAFKVGDVLDSDLVLQAVHTRSVSIGPRGGATLISLELQAPGSTATANLEAGGSERGQAAIAQTPSRQITSERPPTPESGSALSSAPNTLLNNPADMAPADASGGDAPPSG